MSSAEEVRLAVTAGAEAFEEHFLVGDLDHAALLRAIADELDARRDDLISTAMRETSLPQPRLEGEHARTTGQLRAFADYVSDGRHLDRIVDEGTVAQPRQERVNVPIGVVAVYAASNFPFAFSVCGGDTAAALAAGCPVVVKTHPLHPETSALSAAAAHAAVQAVGFPPAWFAAVDGDADVAIELVTAPGVAAAAFTGSRAAGEALVRAAVGRPDPIPVHAEMGSLNPFVVLPEAAAARTDAIAEQVAASVGLGVGQFCTKPGLLLVPDDEAGAALVEGVVSHLRRASPGPMLGERLATGYRGGLARALDEGARPLLEPHDAGGPTYALPAVLEVPAATLLDRDPAQEEIFGPAVVVARYAPADLPGLVLALDGALVGTVWSERSEAELLRAVTRALARRCGRLVHDGVPTGVTVAEGTVHGGPWPATSNPRDTSVGMTAVRRFLRPVGFQTYPPDALPPV